MARSKKTETPAGRLHLKPARIDLIVHDPDTARPLQENGELKPKNAYWLRRLRDGDVIDLDAPRPTPTPDNSGDE